MKFKKGYEKKSRAGHRFEYSSHTVPPYTSYFTINRQFDDMGITQLITFGVHLCLGHEEILGRMRTPVREAFSYGTRHIHCDSMKHKVILHWITMNMPCPVLYVSRMKMDPVREYASSLNTWITITIDVRSGLNGLFLKGLHNWVHFAHTPEYILLPRIQYSLS